MTAAPHVSASSLRLLNDCPRAWWWRYAAGVLAESQSSSTVLGRAVHASLSAWYTSLRNGEDTPSVEAMGRIAAQVVVELNGSPVPIAFDEGEDAQGLVAEASRLIAAFAASPYRPRRVLAVEQPFALAVEQHPITGVALNVDEMVAGVFDLVAEDNEGHLVVVDHKTGKRRPSADGGFDLQMATYAWAARRLYRRPVNLLHQVLLRTKVAAVELHPMPVSATQEAEAIEAVSSGVALVQVAVEHPQPLRLMGRRRSWRCHGCAYQRRCAEERT